MLLTSLITSKQNIPPRRKRENPRAPTTPLLHRRRSPSTPRPPFPTDRPPLRRRDARITKGPDRTSPGVSSLIGCREAAVGLKLLRVSPKAGTPVNPHPSIRGAESGARVKAREVVGRAKSDAKEMRRPGPKRNEAEGPHKRNRRRLSLLTFPSFLEARNASG